MLFHTLDFCNIKNRLQIPFQTHTYISLGFSVTAADADAAAAAAAAAAAYQNTRAHCNLKIGTDNNTISSAAEKHSSWPESYIL